MDVLVWMPLVWLVLAVVFGITEGVTFDFVAIWFAVGAVAAIIPASFHLPVMVQIAVFLLVSVIALIFTRPFVKKWMKVRPVPTNADSLIGRVGVTIREIGGEELHGRVSVAGMDWAAISDDDTVIDAGEKVLIKRIEGVKLIVEKLI